MSGKDKYLYIKDFLSLNPVEYFFIIHSDRLEFIRINNRKYYHVLFTTPYDITSEEGVGKFIKIVVSSPIYYGQPVNILINNSKQFNYIKRAEKEDIVKAFQKLRNIDATSVAFSYLFQKVGKGNYLIAQGIDSTYLTKLSEIINTSKLNVVSIMTLPVFMFWHLPSFPSDKNYLNVLRFVKNQYEFLGGDDKGNVFHGRKDTTEANISVNEIISDISNHYLNSGSVSEVNEFVNFKPEKKISRNTKSLALLFMPRFGARKIPASITYQTFIASKRKSIIQTAANSLKLLFIVFSLIFLVTGLTAGALQLLTNKEDTQSTEYQKIYSDYLETQNRVDSLNEYFKIISGQVNEKVSKATLLSLLCQIKLYNQFLQGIEIRDISPDTVRIELQGYAQNESVIFNYNRKLNELSDPLKFTISSIRPEILNQQGKADTLLRFSFYMILP